MSPSLAGEGGYPLSPMQQGMLFEGLRSPLSGINLQQLLISLPEALEVPCLEEAFQTLAERHQALRSSFLWAGLEAPLQLVAPNVSIPFDSEDLRDMPEGAREERLRSYLTLDRARGFDMGAAPLMRVVLFRLAEAEFKVVWTYHHILIDGRSTALLLEELFDLYEALRTGSSPQLATPRPYRDFIDWLAARNIESSKDYWKNLLEGYDGPVPPGIDKSGQPEPEAEPAHGSEESRLPEALANSLRSSAERNGLTMNTLIQGAWAILLSRYSREDDIVFGATRACRRATVEGADQMVGLFINTLPVRARLAPGTEVLPFLKELRSQAVAVRPHEHTPLYKINEWCGQAPGKSLFESLVVFERNEMIAELRARSGPWSCREVKTIERTSYPLALGVYDGREPLVTIGYDRRRFDDDAILRLLGHFRTILEGIAGGQATLVSELPMLSAPERRQLLVDWNAARSEFPRACVHELFEEQASRQPDAAAAVIEGSAITYGELDRRANQVAQQLRSLDVGPDDIVGLCAERSLQMIAGMLGILKAGAAYLPLDPAYPAARLRFMLEDAGARVLLADPERAADLSAEGRRVIALDSAGQGFPDTRPRGGAAPHNLAYVMYTSGSTGQPKGVAIEHRNVVGFLYSFRPFDFDGERRVGTNVSSFSFDNSVEEIFSCLCFGGTVHVIRPDLSTDPVDFSRYLVEQGINCSYILPDMLVPVARELSKRRGQMQLKCLITGLSPKKQRALQAFRDLSAGLRILNAYGPTEVTYGSTAYEFHQATGPDRDVPIGRPFPNYRVYIVDRDLQPLPVGVPGELLVGGVGVARGYLGQPALTAEKFIPDPFSAEPGARLYRTGDLTRYLADGNIEFLGRIDEQVKIRGYRIEPGEVESALARCPGVERAVVVVRNSPAGDLRLVAYVVLQSFAAARVRSREEIARQAEPPVPPVRKLLLGNVGQTVSSVNSVSQAISSRLHGRDSVPRTEPRAATSEITPAGLREQLRERLPDHMVPSHFVMLADLPLMANGKIDKKALPEPDWSGPHPGLPPAAARDGIDAQLLKIWERVLGVQPIGLGDNFFDLGGHSLLAVSLFAEMAKVFGRHLPLATLFQAPTVERLADLLRKEHLVPDWSPLAPIQPQGLRPPLFCVHANGGNVLFYRELARHLGQDQPFYGLQAIGLDGRQAPLRRVEDMAARYLQEIRGVQPEGPYYLGGFCLGAYIALEMARQLESAGQKVALLAAFASDGSWRKVDSLHKGVAQHLRTLSELDARGKVSYLGRRLRFRSVRFWHFFAVLLAKSLQNLGRPLPRVLRDLSLQESNYRANRRYLAGRYGGRVTFFQPQSDLRSNPQQFWGEVAAGGVEVHVVPGIEEDIFRQPNVSSLASSLQACLDRAQGALP